MTYRTAHLGRSRSNDPSGDRREHRRRDVSVSPRAGRWPRAMLETLRFERSRRGRGAELTERGRRAEPRIGSRVSGMRTRFDETFAQRRQARCRPRASPGQSVSRSTRIAVVKVQAQHVCARECRFDDEPATLESPLRARADS